MTGGEMETNNIMNIFNCFCTAKDFYGINSTFKEQQTRDKYNFLNRPLGSWAVLQTPIVIEQLINRVSH